MLEAVWRIEGEKDGVGVYGQHGLFCAWDWERSWRMNYKTQPLPPADGLKSPISHPELRHGFLTLEQLCTWFSEADLQSMQGCQLAVACYLVPVHYVARGKAQVQFPVSVARKLTAVPIAQFLAVLKEVETV